MSNRTATIKMFFRNHLVEVEYIVHNREWVSIESITLPDGRSLNWDRDDEDDILLPEIYSEINDYEDWEESEAAEAAYERQQIERDN